MLSCRASSADEVLTLETIAELLELMQEVQNISVSH
jgi:hypothetical protein